MSLNNLFVYRIVCEMTEQILGAPWVVIHGTKAYITLSVHVDSQRIPSRDYNPEAKIALTIHDQHRVFHVLLNDPHLFCVNSMQIFLTLRFLVIQIILTRPPIGMIVG